MTNIAPDAPSPQGGDQAPQPSPTPPTPPPLPPPLASGPDQVPETPPSCGGNAIFKSGSLFISSKGIGWTSWKKRWFILTKTSLVFFRSDPSAVQKGNEVNLTLGGIDLNNSGSVVVKEDKKLLTVLFPDGRDGRAFTLKAETIKDLHEWKEALENALSQAPTGAHPVAKTTTLENDKEESTDICPWDNQKEKPPQKSTIIGVPILLALQDVDGAPCFLVKALQFIEEYGIKVEGILRQAADVDDVERRIREYEQGKIEFSPEEDPHIIADCVKYVLREMPSSPVPASCCNALLDSFRKSGNDRVGRINAMRTTICDTFPEPNRVLLQRILLMMQIVVSHKAVNRMSVSAVAACMAPLLLRPLLAGDCEVENDFNVGGDNSVQLLQAAAAANHAQAMVITLLEEYNHIFGEGSVSAELYTDSEDDETDTEEGTEDDEYYEDDETEGEYDDGDEDGEVVSGSCTESDEDYEDDEQSDNEDGSGSGSEVPDADNDSKADIVPPKSLKDEKPEVVERGKDDKPDLSENNSTKLQNEVIGIADVAREASFMHQSLGHGLPCIRKSSSISVGPDYGARNRYKWGRTAGRKNLSMESISFSVEEEGDEHIQSLEIRKADLKDRIVQEVQDNVALRGNLEKEKKALHDRRLALEQDTARLQEQLQKEKDLGAALEAGLKISEGHIPNLSNIDERMRAELEEMVQAQEDCSNLKKKFDDLGVQLKLQRQQNCGSTSTSDVHDFSARGQDHNTKRHKKDKEKDTEAVAPSRLEHSRSKDGHRDKPVVTKSKSNKTRGEDAHKDAPVVTKSKSSKRGGEGNKGLTKLTSRLNFLKERRTTEGRDKVQSSQDTAEKDQKSEKLRKAESHSDHQGKKSESQQQQHSLDRGKSDNHMSVEVEKRQSFDNSSSGSSFSACSKPARSPKEDNSISR